MELNKYLFLAVLIIVLFCGNMIILYFRYKYDTTKSIIWLISLFIFILLTSILWPLKKKNIIFVVLIALFYYFLFNTNFISYLRTGNS